MVAFTFAVFVEGEQPSSGTPSLPLALVVCAKLRSVCERMKKAAPDGSGYQMTTFGDQLPMMPRRFW